MGENELIYIPWACGAISCITAIIGCLGAQFRNKCGRVVLIIYVICLVVSLSLAVGSVAQCFADEANVYNYALRQWRALTATQERVFEWDHLCCNFITIPPCCRFEPSAERYCINEYVCYEKVEVHLLEQFELIKVTSMFHAIILGIVLLLAVSLCIFLHCKEIREQKQLETKPKLMTSYTRNQKQETEAINKPKSTDDGIQKHLEFELTETENLKLKVIESNEVRNNAIFKPETNENVKRQNAKNIKPEKGKNVKRENVKKIKSENDKNVKRDNGKNMKSENGKKIKRKKVKTVKPENAKNRTPKKSKNVKSKNGKNIKPKNGKQIERNQKRETTMKRESNQRKSTNPYNLQTLCQELDMRKESGDLSMKRKSNQNNRSKTKKNVKSKTKKNSKKKSNQNSKRKTKKIRKTSNNPFA